jgi:hypothetical protein
MHDSTASRVDLARRSVPSFAARTGPPSVCDARFSSSSPCSLGLLAHRLISWWTRRDVQLLSLSAAGLG